VGPLTEPIGEKRALEGLGDEGGNEEAPAEKKAKLETGEESAVPTPSSPKEENNPENVELPPVAELAKNTSPPPTTVADLEAPSSEPLKQPEATEDTPMGEDDDDLSQLELSPQSLAQATSSTFGEQGEDESSLGATPSSENQAAPSSPTTQTAAPSMDDIPFPPGYDPQMNAAISQPLEPVAAPAPAPTRRTRRKKSAQLVDEFPDPDSKWSEAATERMMRLFSEFGKRHVLDEKMHNELKMCLDHGGNPAVPLCDRDGVTFFTYLTVAAECGDMELVQIFITQYREEFSAYDLETALQAALAHRQQEIAEYLLKETDVRPTNEAVMEMFDVQMNDEHKRKVLPLRAFLDLCLGERYPPANFFVPEILNRCIYAHNVAALELLFEQEEAKFLPLLVCATPESNNIRAGRGKVQDIGEGVPPLTYAAVMERTECMEVFLKHGANPNFVWNDMGGSLLHIAGWKSNTELIELLLRYGADPRIPNELGQTVLSRTKGRRARKAITDMTEQMNANDGISTAPSSLSHGGGVPMHHHHHHGVPSPMHGGPLPPVGMHRDPFLHAPPPMNQGGSMHSFGSAHHLMNGSPSSPHNTHTLSHGHTHDLHDHHMAQPLPFDGSDDPLGVSSSSSSQHHGVGSGSSDHHESVLRGPVDLLDHGDSHSSSSPVSLSHLTHPSSYTPPHTHHVPTHPLPDHQGDI